MLGFGFGFGVRVRIRGTPLFLEFGFGLGFRSGSGFRLRLGLALVLGLQLKVSPNRAHSSLSACPGRPRLEEGPAALSEAASFCSVTVRWAIREADYGL